MTDGERPARRRIRYPGFDYASAGGYAVTICVDGHRCVFGEISDGFMCPNNAGMLVEDAWCTLEARFPTIVVDAFVVMPNHFHGIVFLGAKVIEAPSSDSEEGGDRNAGAMNRPPTSSASRQFMGDNGVDQVGARLIAPATPQSPANDDGTAPPKLIGPRRDRNTPALGEVIRTFKAVSTRAIRSAGFTDFAWQRIFYDRIIRSDRELNRPRAYIAANPSRWHEDRYRAKG